MDDFKNILSKQIRLSSRNTKIIKRVQDRRRIIFQDWIVRSPEDLVKQNNLILRQVLQQNSVDRIFSLDLAASRGSI